MSKSILLCDDELHILRAAEFKFKRAGFDVRCASDGQEAWEMIQKEKPDMLITDCQMPRLDGIGLSERIHNDPATTGLPVIMLTAKGYELSHEEMSDKFGIRMVVTKPFSPRDLLRRVEETLNLTSDETTAAAPTGQ